MNAPSSPAPSGSDTPTLGTSSGAGRAYSRDEPLRQGDRVGRYLVLRLLGSGGMGVVYAAYDPELDRNVALKLLHGSSATERRRLVAEAQAMARLNHPNVVTVHDVGEHEGRIFVAMEHVEGITLRAWCSAASRQWREIVDVFARAGEGLQAAHARDLVHRDFKPDNVIVGLDPDHGTITGVRVLDFGLARASDNEPLATAEIGNAPATDHTSLFFEGAVVGTPAYMAPEQMEGLADARSDQFSFCVAIHEALHGARPFEGASLAEIALSISEGRVRRTPTQSRVPTWIDAAVRRGLDASPEKRWPSMQALIAAIRDDPSRRRRRVALLGLAAVAIAGGLGHAKWSEHRREVECDAAGRAIATTWNAETRAAIETSIRGSEAPGAVIALERVVPWIDRYTEAWSELRTRACRATVVERSRGEELMQRSHACLDERRDALADRLDRLSVPTPDIVRSAVQSIVSLPRLDDCLDDRWLANRSSPPPEAASEIARIRTMMRDADLEAERGAYAAAVTGLEGARTEADTLGWAPLQAETRLALGDVLSLAGRFDDAEAELTEAYLVAHREGEDAWSSDAATLLTRLVGYELARPDDGRWWGRVAAATLARIGEEQTLDEADLFDSLGAIDYAGGDWVAARDRFGRCLEIREAILGPDHPEVAYAVSRLAILDEEEGHYANAKALYERALAITEEAYGPEHPTVASEMVNLGLLYAIVNRVDEARDLFERALAIDERMLGPDHPSVAADLSNLSMLLDATGHGDEARRHAERALAIREATLGSKHPDVGSILNNLAMMHLRVGHHGEAIPLFERSLAIKAETLAPPHPSLALTHRNLGSALSGLGDHERAREHVEKALQMNLEHFGPAHPESAASRFELGKVQWNADDDRDRARAMVVEAREAFAAAGEGAQGDLALAVAWLATH